MKEARYQRCACKLFSLGKVAQWEMGKKNTQLSGFCLVVWLFFFSPQKRENTSCITKIRKLGHVFKMSLTVAVPAQAVSTPWCLIEPGARTACMLDMLDIF